MEDQDRVEDVEKVERRPSQSSEDTDSWTFLERKSAENSPKPPKIAVNSNLLAPPDYDAEPEMSDGISVISEGDGHQTPPESDAGASHDDLPPSSLSTAAPQKNTEKKVAFSYDDIKRTILSSTRVGYRPLTPPNTPPTEDKELAEINRDLVDLPLKEKKERLDVESYLKSDTETARRFIGIYPRHVVFLMVICGIIGGMIGHLWNIKYGCQCGEETKKLTDMYTTANVEKWNVEQKLKQCNEKLVAVQRKQEHQLQEFKKVQQEFTRLGIWTGAQEMDKFIRADNPKREMTTDEFERVLWQHLWETDPAKRANDEEYARRMRRTPEEYYKKEAVENRKVEEEKLRQEFIKKHSKRDVHSGEDSHEIEVDVDSKESRDSKEKVDKRANNKKYLGGGSGEKKSYKSKEEHKYNKHYRGSGDGGKQGVGGNNKQYRNRGDNSDEDSREKKYEERRRYPQQPKQKEKENYKKKNEHSSGEWSDKRNRGRDELRQQNKNGREEKKNWYLERGSEREINRVETSAI